MQSARTRQPEDPDGDTTNEVSGGARRDRTDDILLAKQALSQLSYGPKPFIPLPLPRLAPGRAQRGPRRAFAAPPEGQDLAEQRP